MNSGEVVGKLFSTMKPIGGQRGREEEQEAAQVRAGRRLGRRPRDPERYPRVLRARGAGRQDLHRDHKPAAEKDDGHRFLRHADLRRARGRRARGPQPADGGRPYPRGRKALLKRDVLHFLKVSDFNEIHQFCTNRCQNRCSNKKSYDFDFTQPLRRYSFSEASVFSHSFYSPLLQTIPIHAFSI